MKKVLAFAGSTSSSSINKQLASLASSLVDNAEVELLDMKDHTTILYSTDQEKNGFPENMQALSTLFDSCDGFVISLAEHNGSYAAAYKNTIDWLSRINREVFGNKPMLLMAASPGGRGGASVLEAAKAYYPRLGANIVSTFSLPGFYDNFQDGKLATPELQAQLQSAVTAFQDAL